MTRMPGSARKSSSSVCSRANWRRCRWPRNSDHLHLHLLIQATAKKMMKSRSSQLSTSRAFCQNLRGILDKSEEEERWEVVRGEFLPKKEKESFEKFFQIKWNCSTLAGRSLTSPWRESSSCRRVLQGHIPSLLQMNELEFINICLWAQAVLAFTWGRHSAPWGDQVQIKMVDSQVKWIHKWIRIYLPPQGAGGLGEGSRKWFGLSQTASGQWRGERGDWSSQSQTPSQSSK